MNSEAQTAIGVTSLAKAERGCRSHRRRESNGDGTARRKLASVTWQVQLLFQVNYSLPGRDATSPRNYQFVYARSLCTSVFVCGQEHFLTSTECTTSNSGKVIYKYESRKPSRRNTTSLLQLSFDAPTRATRGPDSSFIRL